MTNVFSVVSVWCTASCYQRRRSAIIPLEKPHSDNQHDNYLKSRQPLSPGGCCCCCYNCFCWCELFYGVWNWRLTHALVGAAIFSLPHYDSLICTCSLKLMKPLFNTFPLSSITFFRSLSLSSCYLLVLSGYLLLFNSVRLTASFTDISYSFSTAAD